MTDVLFTMFRPTIPSDFRIPLINYLHQFERGEALENITQDVRKALAEESDEESLKVVSKTVDSVRKEVSMLIWNQIFVTPCNIDHLYSSWLNNYV